MHFALLGHRIGHSLSPHLQAAAAESIGCSIRYTLMDVEAHQLDRVLEQMKKGHWDGVNVTSPYKRWAWESVDDHGTQSHRLGVVNTIVPVGTRRLRGDNTDLLGFTHLLGDLPRRSPMVLGAGGAARVVVDALNVADPDRLLVFNRNPARIADLQSFGGGRIQGMALDAVESVLRTTDLVINCLPPSASSWLCSLPFGQLPRSAVVVDLNYGLAARPFSDHVRTCGRHARDGLEMLIAQGIESFRLWTGEKPDSDYVGNAVRRAAREQALD